MEIKHQVFVSSTYNDLIAERKQVIHALLELDCIPSGMELFPATDEDAWSLIMEVIDNCDYYILIIGGKYGSTNPDGISFTELEYDYAASIGKPIISFLHSNIGELSTNKTETSEKKQEKLKLFRDKAERKHCKFWNSAEDLGGKVSRSLVQLKKRQPSPGWVPGRYAADEKMLREFEEMRRQIAQLKYEALAIKEDPPPDTDDLEQGVDLMYLVPSMKKSKGGNSEDVDISSTWDNLFSYAGSALIGECDENEFEEKIRLAFWHQTPNNIREFNEFRKSIIIPYVVFDQIKIQFQALGLIT
jgi:hypothetical protein